MRMVRAAWRKSLWAAARRVLFRGACRMEQMAKLGFYCAGNPWLAFPYHATNGGVEGQTLATIWYLLQIPRLQVLHNAPRNIRWNIALRYALILPVVKRERGGLALDGWTGDRRGGKLSRGYSPGPPGYGAGQPDVPTSANASP